MHSLNCGVDKRKWILVSSLVVIVGTVCALLFWPENESDERTSESLEAPFVPIEFLNEDPSWAIAMVDSMNLDEKLSHLIIQKINSEDDSIGPYGGFYFKGNLPGQMARLHPLLKDSLQPLIGLSIESALAELEPEDALNVLASNHQNHQQELIAHLDHLIDYYGVNYVQFGSVALSKSQFDNRLLHHLDPVYSQWQDSLLQRHCLLSYAIPDLKDSVFSDSVGNYVDQFVNRGFAVLKQAKVSSNYERFINQLDFKGLNILEPDTVRVLDAKQGDGIITDKPSQTISELKSMVKSGKLSENEINAKVAKMLLARKWAQSNPNAHHSDRTARYFQMQGRYLARKLQRNAITLVKNNRSLIPLAGIPDKIDLIRLGNPIKSIYANLNLYTDVNALSYKEGQLSKIPWKNLGKRTTVMAINIDSVDILMDSAFQENLAALQNKCPLIVINGSGSRALNALQSINSLLNLPTASDYEWKFAGQLLFGGIEARGVLAQNVGELKAGSGNQTIKSRLAYGDPIDVGLDKDTLRAIRYIAEEGIRNRAYPGCQVMVTKDGFLIHDGNYGFSSYKRQIKVNSNHLYDLASVTKVAATTVAAMKLFDEEKYGLYDSLERHLPDTLRKHLFRGLSTLRHITFSELMTHQSGLPAGLSYIQYVDYIKDSVGRFDRFYCDLPDDSMFYVPIADGLYMENVYQDSIWISLNQMWLRDTKSYLYSDANFVLLYKLLRGFLDQDERLVKKGRNEEKRDYNSFERYLQEQVYRPLKMERTVFLPRRYFSTDEIAPTEDDKFWRRQLVHGYVHDPTAALLGGISGNAGLFSTGKDMVKLFQMLLNGGYYGGTRFIEEATVNRFVRAQPGSHRGLGFNKPVGGGMYGIPEEVSLQTFGHTGFTGNSVWADPENDIIYIFLSNRSHPDAHNPKIINLGTRKRIHKSVYRARITKDWLIPPPPELSDSTQLEEVL